MTEAPNRCAWAQRGDALYEAYHDTEWGVPEYDSRALWEKLMLDGFQAGLAWITVLRKREAFRAGFEEFDPDKVAAFGEKDYQQLQIIRRMTADLDLPIEIMAVKTVRDDHGLALSSRNAYLTAEERKIARQLNKILARTGLVLRAGADVAEACARAEQDLLDAGFTSVDYVAFADPDSLAPLTTFAGRGRVLAAARLGKTRLIDNMAV